MTTLEIILATIIVTAAFILLAHRLPGWVGRFERREGPKFSEVNLKGMSREEARCVSLVERRWKKPLLHYLRTLEASHDLQQYLVSNRKCLAEVKRFIQENWYEGESP